MIGIGTLVNVVTIIIGSIFGLILKHNLKEKYKDMMLSAVGLSTLILGFSGALAGIFKIEDNIIGEQYLIEIILFLVIGSMLGVGLKISERLDQLGIHLQNKFGRDNSNFSKGFVSASLIFCIGAMAIMGAIEDGMNQNYTILFSKAILDGFTSMVLASTLGIGVMFSIVPLALYQLTITIIAYFMGDFLPLETKVLMNIIGSILIIGISFNILEIKKIKVADMLPAIFIPIIYVIIKQALF